MKEIINEQEVKKLNHYSTIYAVHFIVLLLSAVPLFMWLEMVCADSVRNIFCYYYVLGIEG